MAAALNGRRGDAEEEGAPRSEPQLGDDHGDRAPGRAPTRIAETVRDCGEAGAPSYLFGTTSSMNTMSLGVFKNLMQVCWFPLRSAD